MRAGPTVALLTLVCAAVARPAPADACQQWKVPLVFIAQQDDRYEVSFQLKQSGSTLSGYARYATNKRTVIGNVVQATLTGNRFSARVLWTYSGAGGIGRYIGVVDPSGHLHGNVHDEQSPKPVNVGWRSPQPMRCDLGPVEPATDRPGSDYRNFDLATASYENCRAACDADQKCRTYVYVKPGVQGPKARCWLKANVPAQRPSECCLSGVIRPGATAGSTSPIDTIPSQKPPLVTNQAMPNIKDKTRPSSSGAVMQFPTKRPRPIH